MAILKTGFAAIALVAMAPAAFAAGYTVSPIGEGADFVGCLAQNTAAGVGFLAVGDKLVVFGNSSKFPFAKGAMASGAWSVDGGASYDFASKADSANTVTLDVPNTQEAVTALTSGKELAITANKISVTFNLDGSGQAFADLVTCMETKKAP